MTTAPPTLDSFLRLGRYSLLFIILSEFTVVMQTGNLIFMSFAGSHPKISECTNANYSSARDFDLCSLMSKGQCDLVYTHPFHSINQEWNLICDKKPVVKDSTSYQMIGSVVGCFVFGPLSDRFGRKWLHLLCLGMTSLLCMSTVFSPNPTVFTILRTFAMFFNAGSLVILLPYMCEVFPRRHLLWLNFLLSISLNFIVVTVFAYLSADWKSFSRNLSLVGVVPFILSIFARESPYFLARKGRVTEAKHVLLFIGHVDRVLVDKDYLDQQLALVAQVSQKSGGSTPLQLFTRPRLALYAAVFGMSFFVVNLLNGSAMFNTEDLPGSMFTNMMVLGGMRFAITIIGALVDMNSKGLGRKPTHLFCAINALFALGLFCALKIIGVTGFWHDAMGIIFIWSVSISCQIMVVCAITTTEIFPPAIRNSAYALNIIFMNVGSLVAPQFSALSSVYPTLPYLIMFGLLTVELLLCMIFIPESKGKISPAVGK